MIHQTNYALPTKSTRTLATLFCATMRKLTQLNIPEDKTQINSYSSCEREVIDNVQNKHYKVKNLKLSLHLSLN